MLTFSCSPFLNVVPPFDIFKRAGFVKMWGGYGCKLVVLFVSSLIVLG